MSAGETDRRARGAAEIGLGAAWMVGLGAAVQIVERLPIASIGAALLGAVVVDIGATRAGVRYERDDRAPGRAARAARRVAVGAAVALGAGAVVIAVGSALGWLGGHGAGIAPSSALVYALARSAAVAVRDELLYRGLPLFAATMAGWPPAAGRVFAALAGGAAIALVPGVSLAAVVLAVAAGWLFASLWQREGGAWAALGAHTGWMLLFGSVLHGGLFDLDWQVGELAVGNTSRGAPAWLAAAVLVIAALLVPRIPFPRDEAAPVVGP